MNKLLEALSKLLPEEQMKDVAAAVDEMVAEVKTDVEAQANKELENAYAELSGEVKESEKVAEEGYRQAWDVITELRNRIEMQRVEYEKAVEENYEQAYQYYLTEKAKNESLEVDLHSEYEQRFNKANEELVDKVHEFLKVKGKEIYEMARRDIMSDPRQVEHKIVLDKIVEQVSDYIDDEDRVFATGNRMKELEKSVSESAGRVKILEAKNIRLSNENLKLNEAVKQAENMLTESKKAVIKEEKQERVATAKRAEGRGSIVEDKRVKVIAEHNDAAKTVNEEEEASTILEGFTPEQMDRMRVLAGVQEQD